MRVTWHVPSSRLRRAVVAFILDRREQYQPSSGSYNALSDLADEIREGRDVDAYEHGELDDLLAADGYPKSKAATKRKKLCAAAGCLEIMGRHVFMCTRHARMVSDETWAEMWERGHAIDSPAWQRAAEAAKAEVAALSGGSR